MELDIVAIQKIIPHRYPFLMIDKVTEIEPNDHLVAIKNVSVNEQFFVGHFPKEKIMPGVLMIEAMAQAGCVFYYYSKNMQGKELTYYLAKADAKFVKPVVPGDQLRIHITPIKLMSKAGILKGEITVAGQKVAEAELGFGIKEN